MSPSRRWHAPTASTSPEACSTACPTSRSAPKPPPDFPASPASSPATPTAAPLVPRFVFEAAEATATTLSLRYRDAPNGLTYRADFTLDADTRMLTAEATLDAEAPVFLDWLAAPVLPAPQLSDVLIDFAGRWCGEFQPQTTPWTAGIRKRDNRTGRSGHEHFPGLVVPLRGATNTHGTACGFHYGWSGGHGMLAEELPDGRRQIQFGHAAGSESTPGRHFATARLFATWSDTGLNGCAVAFQRHLRERIVAFPHPAQPRPVHYNCWEAVYFDHDLAALTDIASRAARLGAERFVLDDGWFGRRDDDTSSLGDWRVDRRKYPDGLTPLIDHVRSLGMSFGLWVEPEMISADSDTCRAHPDWVLGPPEQPTGRNQFALDMANPEVRDFLCAEIGALLCDNAIDYLKWDHNRVLPGPDAAQTRGTLDLLDRLRRDFPAVEIESCASGGGRIDFGILSRTHRVWLSDSNDALERLRIQHEAARFLPACVTGSHVGPRRCHTSGRVLDMHLRAWVAAQRHMGFEMDPRELTEDEATVLRDVTAWWKANRAWLMQADILRLDSAETAICAEQHLAAGRERFVVFAGRISTAPAISPRPLCLTGLDPEASYRIDLATRDSVPGLSRGTPALKAGPVSLSGRYLMEAGLVLPWAFPASIHVVEGTRLP